MPDNVLRVFIPLLIYLERIEVLTIRKSESEILLTPSEVAAKFRVDPKTVTRWAKSGKLTAIRTLGGHRRYRQSEVEALLRANDPIQKNI